MTLRNKAGQSILALAFFAGAGPMLHAQAHDTSHMVRFDVGDTYFLDGDSITVESITGPAETISRGNVYLVTGTYKLTSHPNAVLSTNVTTKGPSGETRNHDAASEPRNVAVQQGEGHFSLYLHMDTDGYPHLSFYPTAGGNSFAGVYFGTGASLMRHHAKVQDSVSR